MGIQKNVLLVTNSATETEIDEIKQAIIRAEEQGMKIKLNLVHVVPTLPTCYFNIPSMVLLAERYYEEAKHSLTYIGGLLNVAHRDQWLITGRIRTEVLRLAHKLNSHFILASSLSIQDLRKTFLFNREQGSTPIKSMSHVGLALGK